MMRYFSNSMRKQLWIMVKQFLLYLLLDNMAMVVVIVPLVIDAMMKGYRGKDVLEYADPSMSTTLWIYIIGYIITIAVFQKMRYVRLSTGHIAHSNYWKAAGYAMLIAWAWVITKIGCLLLVDLFFPGDAEEDSWITENMQYPLLMFIAGCILAPISEEIVFRGILVGGTASYATKTVGGYSLSSPRLCLIPRRLFAVGRSHRFWHHLWLALLAHEESPSWYSHTYHQ